MVSYFKCKKTFQILHSFKYPLLYSQIEYSSILHFNSAVVSCNNSKVKLSVKFENLTHLIPLYFIIIVRETNKPSFISIVLTYKSVNNFFNFQKSNKQYSIFEPNVIITKEQFSDMKKMTRKKFQQKKQDLKFAEDFLQIKDTALQVTITVLSFE